MTVGQIIAEPLGRPRHRARSRGRAKCASGSCSATPGLCPAMARPLSARAVGRPAPARRHRPRARHGADADRLRRAGVRPRRVHPGADHQPARGAPDELRADLPVRGSRPLRGPPHLRPGGRDVPGQDRRAHRPASRSTRIPSIPTRRRSSPPCPSRIRRWRRSASAPCWAEKSRARSTLRPAACFIRGVPSPSRSARRGATCSEKFSPGTLPPASEFSQHGAWPPGCLTASGPSR